MKAVFFLLIVVIVVGVACQSSSKKILEIDKMKVLLMHQLMVEEFHSNFQYRDTISNKDSLRSVGFAQVLNIHKVDSAQFYKSLNYYKSEPVLYQKLLDSANAYATRERELRYMIDAAPNDSILPNTGRSKNADKK